jgi:hypothetical protein
VIPLTWADFLLGQPEVAYGFGNIYESFEGLGNKDRDWRYKSGDGFIQDGYMVAKRLTLNLGLRYEHIGNFGEASGKAGNVVVSALNPNPGTGGSYDGYLIGSNYKGRSDTWEEHNGVRWRRPECMESACGVCLDAARLGTVCSAGRYRHVSLYDHRPDDSANERGRTLRFLE